MDFKTAVIKHSEISRELAAVAMGQLPGEIIIRNGKLVNVLTALIEDKTDVILFGGFIAFVGDASEHPVGDTTQIIDAEGKYIIPGLIDSHMHVESSMIDLRFFAAGILPHGTTTICPDNHEMTNVFGLKAVELFHNTAENLPLNVLTAMPVCVPSIPGMENAGSQIGAEEVKTAYKEGWAELQGEQMNFPGVIFGDPHVHSITAEGVKADKVLTGHYASADLNRGLNAFIASGMTACHESTTADEALMKVSRGMYVQQRFGTAWLDLPNLIPAFLDNPEMDTRMFTMVTDDVTPVTITEEGHLVRVLREAVKLGVPSLKALQMVTVNAAQLLDKSRWIGSVSPGKSADILLVDDMKDFNISVVISNGTIAARDGKLCIEIPPYEYPDWALNSIHIDKQSADDFIIATPSDESVEARVIRLIPGMVYTKEESMVLNPVNGSIQVNGIDDLAKMAMIYRHKPTISDADRKAFGLLRGLTLKPHTAIATTVSHDCHNLLVIGTDNAAMALAANSLIESGGGITVVQDGKISALLALPFAGLMSLKPIAEVSEELKSVEEAIRLAGCPHDSVEMTISLLGLIVLGELHLSNKGLVRLVDGEPPCFVDLFKEDEK
ncbi:MULTISPECIES: adenine deaminase [unclassified Oceanispirochaeta]|uniref:adenine deaminase n=1 Tax=unclassified Oceanispirochaeta TaxID=2635722 RepID=UPI000E095A09|nr:MULTISPECIES: adenine deaminase C-terminal domain-containing protein [unclassified Oceanispirochaeta]MBF9016033.1 adenine deaminase [Oceanispirochaeta sp. M2]NPD72496.1 adenine deaminase [Oceanispirochaeta sp. M1]RDG31955.1 adenine deaminase [Oceanispirochaeta sp. M1]